MTVRVMDYTVDVYCVGVYQTLHQLSKGVAAYIAQCDGQCTELRAEQWDPERELWISYSTATNTAQQTIAELFSAYEEMMR